MNSNNIVLPENWSVEGEYLLRLLPDVWQETLSRELDAPRKVPASPYYRFASRGKLPNQLNAGEGSYYPLRSYFIASRTSLISAEDVYETALKLVRALKPLHQAGLMHGSLTPDAVLIHPDKDLRIIQWAFCNSPADLASRLPNWFLPGLVNYLSPEQSGKTSFKPGLTSDIYAIGCILYEMITGVMAFAGEDTLHVIFQHLTREPAALTQYNATVGQGLERIILNCLNKNPNERYQSLEELEADLQQGSLWLKEGKPELIPAQLQAQRYFQSDRLYLQAFTEEKDNLVSLITGSSSRTNSTIISIIGPEGGQKEALLKNVAAGVKSYEFLYFYASVQDDTLVPYHSIRKVLDQIYHYLLSLPQDQIQVLKYQLQQRLGITLPLLLYFHPSLQKILGDENSAFDLPADVNMGRQISYAFSIFIQALQNLGKPIILAFTHFDKAPLSTQNIVEGLFQEVEIAGLTLLFTSENEDTWLLAGVEKSLVRYEKIELDYLTEKQVQDMLLRTGFGAEQLKAGVTYLLSQCGGKYDVLEQALKELNTRGWIKKSSEQGTWYITQHAPLNIDMEMQGAELYYQKLIQSLDADELQVLEAAAAWGPAFDPQWMSPAFSLHVPLAEVLEKLLLRQIIQAEPGIRNQYRFLNRKFYTMLQARVNTATKANIIQVWQAKEAGAENSLEVLPVLLQLDPKTASGFKSLILQAAEKAREIAAFDLYYQALKLLYKSIDDEAWTKDFDQSLFIGSQLLVASSLSAQTEGIESLFETLKRKVQNPSQRLQVYHAYGDALLAKQDFRAHLALCIDVLKEWGIQLNTNPNLFHIIMMSVRTDRLMKNKDAAFFLNMPEMVESDQKYIMLFLQSVMGTAYILNPKMIPELVFRQTERSFRYGMSQRFGICLSSYAFLLSIYQKQLSKSQEIQHIADDLNTRFAFTEGTLVSNFLWYAFCANWHQPLHETRDQLLQNYYNCRQLGLVNIAFYTLSFYVVQNGLIEAPFTAFLQEIEGLLAIPKIRQQPTTLEAVKIPGYYLDYEVNERNSAQGIEDEFMERFNRYFEQYDSTLGLILIIQDNIHCALEGKSRDTERKAMLIDRAKKERGKGFYPFLDNEYWLCLNMLNEKEVSSSRRKRIRRLLAEYKEAARDRPENNLARYYFLQACLDLKDGNSHASDGFIKAYEQAIQDGFLLTAAMAARNLAAVFAVNGLPLTSVEYRQKEADALEKIGARRTLKRALQQLPKQAQRAGANDNLLAGSAIDLLSFTRASNSIAQEIKLDQMLKKMLQVLIENAGAQSVYFYIQRNNQLLLLASMDGKEQIHQPPVVAGEGQHAMSLLRYSFRTAEVVLLDNAAQDHIYGSDPYIRAKKVKSVCCLPVVKNQEVIGLIYLENNLLAGAFVKERLGILTLFASQIAISFENANLYSEMEQKVLDRTSELHAEMEKSDRLLLNIIPADIAEELKTKGSSEAKLYDQVSVIFTDFVNFTGLSEQLSPTELVAEIHKNFTAFDAIIEKHGLEKIKTIGDAYLAVCGLPVSTKDHALRVVRAALEITDYMKKSSGKFRVRIGINSGSVVAGIVGVKKYAYDIWGDTVNTAARMEQNSEAGKINISGSTYELIKNDFVCHYRGKVEAKNKGEIDMFFVEGAAT